MRIPRITNYANSSKTYNKTINKNGFTLVELLIVMGIFVVIASVSIPLYSNWQPDSQIDTAFAEVIETLRLGRNRSESGLNNASHGVYFLVSESGEDSYVLYQGADYASRDVSLDREIILNNALSLTTSLDNANINFSKGLGEPSATGTVSIINNNTDEIKIISINSLGIVNST
ncbi:hypothetical protein DRH27_01965 [Candidatus Falkowbacteria bacterium]|nr:MAG: hypothetical protein DRH27_01965 [Candidatus Falkowbacteria bacterium]